MIELKTCPFCGSENVTVKGSEMTVTRPNPFVYCRNCHAHGPQRISYLGAENAWNSRADEPKRIDGKPTGMSAEQFDAIYEDDSDEDSD